MPRQFTEDRFCGNSNHIKFCYVHSPMMNYKSPGQRSEWQHSATMPIQWLLDNCCMIINSKQGFELGAETQRIYSSTKSCRDISGQGQKYFKFKLKDRKAESRNGRGCKQMRHDTFQFHKHTQQHITQMAHVTQYNTQRTHDILKICEHTQHIRTITHVANNIIQAQCDNRRWTYGTIQGQPCPI